MAARRGKSQARRNSGNSGGLPGWAWLILGIVIALVAVLAAPRLLKPEGGDGFILPRPNPDARPAAASDAGEDDLPVPARPKQPAAAEDAPEREYDFYTVLPGQEVAMSDAELAASARAEAERQRRQAEAQAAARAADDSGSSDATASPALPAPIDSPADDRAAEPTAAAPTPTPAAQDNQARYLLQAGAFGASGDAEALKARIALLGLNARVESAAIGGKTVYRVRMGPYGTATELAIAKGKLANGGLPAMAIKVK